MLSFDGEYYLKAIERAGEDRFLLRLCSSKGNERTLFLLRNKSNNDEVPFIYYTCENDEDSSLFMTTETDIKSIMKTVSEFAEKSPPHGDRNTLD